MSQGVEPRPEFQEVETVAPPQIVEHPFEFHGEAGEYFRIWIVNLFLTVATLGIYSAWAKVRSARYFASSTRLAGASFAYLADPLAILKGRLLVFGFLGLYAVASLVSSVLDVAMSVVLFLAIPWAVIRSMAFRTHNTTWRNIRFGFRAGYGEAFGAYLGYPMLGVLTLGILYPNAMYRERRFVVTHARYGSTHFEFGSTNGDFYRAAGMILALMVAMGLSVGAAFALAGAAAGPAVVAVSLPFYFLLFGYISSLLTNLTYEGSRIGAHTLRSNVPAARLSGLYLTNALAIVASLGLLIPWTRVRTARFRCRYVRLEAVGDLDAFVAGQSDDVGSVGAELGDSLGIDLGL